MAPPPAAAAAAASFSPLLAAAAVETARGPLLPRCVGRCGRLGLDWATEPSASAAWPVRDEGRRRARGAAAADADAAPADEVAETSARLSSTGSTEGLTTCLWGV